jgi:hypothetical protein
MFLFIQEDVLRELMMQGVKATEASDRRESLLAKMESGEAAKPDFLKKKKNGDDKTKNGDDKDVKKGKNGKPLPPFLQKKKK